MLYMPALSKAIEAFYSVPFNFLRIDLATSEDLTFCFIHINQILLKAFVETFCSFLHRCPVIDRLRRTRILDLLRGAYPSRKELTAH